MWLTIRPRAPAGTGLPDAGSCRAVAHGTRRGSCGRLSRTVSPPHTRAVSPAPGSPDPACPPLAPRCGPPARLWSARQAYEGDDGMYQFSPKYSVPGACKRAPTPTFFGADDQHTPRSRRLLFVGWSPTVARGHEASLPVPARGKRGSPTWCAPCLDETQTEAHSGPTSPGRQLARTTLTMDAHSPCAPAHTFTEKKYFPRRYHMYSGNERRKDAL